METCKFGGFDFCVEVRGRNPWLRKAGLEYTYLNLSKENPYKFSKYVFDYNRHKLVNNFEFDIRGIEANIFVNFLKPIERRGYVTVDFKAQKEVSDFVLSIEGINIFNHYYLEKEGIKGSGRWFKISVEYHF